MKKQLFALLFALVPMAALAAGGEGVHLRSMSPDLENQASLQSGMKLYVNYCMGCHSLEYQRFSRAAEDLDMPQDLVEDNLIFSPDLGYNDQMHKAMSAEDAEVWFGKACAELGKAATPDARPVDKSPPTIRSMCRRDCADKALFAEGWVPGTRSRMANGGVGPS